MYRKPRASDICIGNVKGKVDLVFMVDGTEKMTYFIDALGNVIDEITKSISSNYPDHKFRYGGVVYRDRVVTQEMQGVDLDKNIWIDLDENPQNVKNMFKTMKKCGGGNYGAEDWLSGYLTLLNKINFDEDSIKIVIHVCTSPGHGKTFTGKRDFINNYINIPSFSSSNSYLQNKEIYDGIQHKQDGFFKKLINEASNKKISFYCINGSEYSMQCFNRTRSLYITHDDCKFIVKNEFGYIFEPSSFLCNSELKVLERKLCYNIRSGISVIINYKKNRKVSEYERDTEEEFYFNYDEYEASHFEKSKIEFIIGKYIENEITQLDIKDAEFTKKESSDSSDDDDKDSLNSEDFDDYDDNDSLNSEDFDDGDDKDKDSLNSEDFDDDQNVIFVSIENDDDSFDFDDDE